ncbi:MAG: hypothetical protein IJ012_03630, partial [Clostridia bacterium]|nr:hypothetical protein [Clostridia bacterium]
FTPEFLAANPNLQVTLELKVFTEDENGNKIDDISVATNEFDKGDFGVAAVVANGKQTQYFATLADAIAAAVAGDTVVLLDDATVTQKFTLNGVNIDLNGNTLYLTTTGSGIIGEVTISNGTIDISGGTADTGNCYFTVGGTWAEENSHLTLSDVNLVGKDYTTKWAVICVHNGTKLTMTDCTVTLENDNGTAGGFIKDTSGNNNTATVLIENSTLTLTNVDRGFTGANVTLDNSVLTITGGEHGINGSELTVKDSTVSISDGTGRGITLNKFDASIVNSTVTVSNMGEGGIRFKTANTLTVDGTSTLNEVTAHADVEGANVNGYAVTGKETDMSTVKVAEGVTTVVNPIYVAEVGGVQYKTLAEAIAAAVNGDVITVLRDVDLTGEYLFLEDGVTFDLNGCTVTAKGLVAFGNDACVLDNGETKGRLALPDMDHLVLHHPKYGMLPVWAEDGSGYVFTTVTPTNDVYSAGNDSFYVEYRPALTGYIRTDEIFKDGAADNGITFQIVIHCYDANGNDLYQPVFSVSDDLIAEVYTAVSNGDVSTTLLKKISGAGTNYAKYGVEMQLISTSGIAFSKMLDGTFTPAESAE